MSSFGNAPSRQKSIDVEFNLLRTWSDARLDLHRRLARGAALGVGVLVLGGTLLPFLASARIDVAARAAHARREAKAAIDRADTQEARAKVATPVAEREAAIVSSARRVDALLSGLATVLNEAPDTLLVKTLQFDVNAGKLGVRLQARAPDPATARAFARRVGALAGIEGAKASSILDDGENVTFDFSSTGALAP